MVSQESNHGDHKNHFSVCKSSCNGLLTKQVKISSEKLRERAMDCENDVMFTPCCRVKIFISLHEGLHLKWKFIYVNGTDENLLSITQI